MIAIAVASRLFSSIAIALAASLGHAAWPLLTPDHGPFVAWDGQWYLAIATHGYHALPIQAQHHDFAFFPAWPALIAIATLGVLPPGLVAVLLANLLFVAALVMTAHVLARTHDETTALRGAALLAFSPPAFVFSMAYSEALFFAVAAAFFLVAPTVKGRPLVLAAAMLTRITGAGLIAAAGAASWRRASSGRNADLVAVVAGFLAFAAWWTFVAALTSDPLGFLHGALGWQSSSGPLALARAVRSIDALGLLEYAFAALILAGSVALVRLDRPMATFAICGVVIGLLFGRDSSVARYALAGFPAFGMLAALAGRRTTAVLWVSFVIAQVLLVAAAFSFGSASQPP